MTDLPPGWAKATLADIASWGSGGTPKTSEPRYYGGSTPWAVIGDLNDEVITQTAGTITEDGLNSSSAKLVPPGTVLVAMYGASIGKLGIAGIPMATNQAIAFARVHESAVDAKYLFWYLRSQRDELLNAGKGAAQRNISQTLLRSWPIPIPPLNEQSRIVATLEDHLSRMDSANIGLRRVKRRFQSLEDILRSQAVRGGKEWSIKNDLLDLETAPPESSATLPLSWTTTLPPRWGLASLAQLLEEGRKAAYGVLVPGTSRGIRHSIH